MICVYLPHVSNDRSVSPRMLSVDAHFTILVDNQIEGFIKPSEGGEKLVVSVRICGLWCKAVQLPSGHLGSILTHFRKRLGLN